MRRSLQGGRGQVYGYVFERLVSVMSEPGGGGGCHSGIYKLSFRTVYLFEKAIVFSKSRRICILGYKRHYLYELTQRNHETIFILPFLLVTHHDCSCRSLVVVFERFFFFLFEACVP